jgi:hypothetical protein
VTARLGVRLTGTRRDGAGPADLVGLAVRRNPRRAHLLVSTVLGKHVPADPRLVYGAGLMLGALVRDVLAGTAPGTVPPDRWRPLAAALSGSPGTAAAFRDGLRAAAGPPVRAVVVGYAETATSLGHSVADALGDAYYLHSTRRPVEGVGLYGKFEEEHSHATGHLLLPVPAAPLDADLPLVLVDDELSTGTTVRNTIRALHAVRPRGHYVVASLVDLRGRGDRNRLDAMAAELGTRVDAVALATARVLLPPDVLPAAHRLVTSIFRHDHPAPPDEADDPGCGTGRPGVAGVRRVDLGWPAGLPDGGRHGFTPQHRARLEAALPSMAGRIADALSTPLGESVRGRLERGAVPVRVLVLGTEELMYAPLRLAEELAGALAAEVRFSTTTRSPVLAVDDPGYPIRTRLAFPAHDAPPDGPGERYAYNVAPGSDPGRAFDAIVLVADQAADTPELHAAGGLLGQLTALGAPVALAVIPAARPAPRRDQAPPAPGQRQARPAPAPKQVPPARAVLERTPEPLRGPEFGSYRPEDVAWLLTDLSGVELEAPPEEREEAIQAGTAHYAESLPVEYQPGAEYRRLFHEALDASATRLAYAVGVITELILAERGPGAVLVSLARAGTPVGVLVRRWAAYAHGLDLPHYAVSIVRGRGIDQVALAHLAAHHDPRQIMFVDGWTGKGAITAELTEALAGYAKATGRHFPDDLAVLADPGRCARIFGTREDFLIPSACLNSTVSGLVSRTVLNPALIGPGDFHGAKFYAGLAGADVSATFLDAVCGRFGAVAGRVGADRAALAAADRTPDWSGWAAVRRIGREYGITDHHLIKPGVGETTRVLLRRVPWRILVRAGAGAELSHLRLLAAERGVPVVEVDPAAMPYACVGLIKPMS